MDRRRDGVRARGARWGGEKPRLRCALGPRRRPPPVRVQDRAYARAGWLLCLLVLEALAANGVRLAEGGGGALRVRLDEQGDQEDERDEEAEDDGEEGAEGDLQD